MAIMVASCSDEDNINDTDAVVSFSVTSVSVKENRGLFNIPIAVKGDRNGDVIVAVDVSSIDPDCRENEQYIVTSKTITIPKHKNSANVEIKTVENGKQNPNHTFVVTITSVKGATIDASLASANVTLIDKDSNPYDRMEGTWIVSAYDNIEPGNEKVSWETKLEIVSDSLAEGYESVITMAPWRLFNGEITGTDLDVSHKLEFHYYKATQTATVTFNLGQIMCSEIIFGDKTADGFDLSNCTVRSATSSMTGHTLRGTVNGTVNSDFTHITFDLPLIGVIFDANNSPYSYWFYYSEIEMTKKL